MKNPSYVELCLSALPPEKQAAARRAFHDLVEGAPDDSMLSRLLIVLEATSAFGKTIPVEIATAVEKVLPMLDARLGQLAQATRAEDERRLTQIRELIQKQLPAMAAALSVEKQADATEALRVSIEHLERGVSRLRHLRVGVVTTLLLFAAVVGAGGTVAYFRKDYDLGQRARLHLGRLADHGVSIHVTNDDDNGFALRVDGPGILKGTDWRRDANGHVIGVNLVYPQP